MMMVYIKKIYILLGELLIYTLEVMADLLGQDIIYILKWYSRFLSENEYVKDTCAHSQRYTPLDDDVFTVHQ